MPARRPFWVVDVAIIANLYHEIVVGALDGQYSFIEQATIETETLERCSFGIRKCKGRM